MGKGGPSALGPRPWSRRIMSRGVGARRAPQFCRVPRGPFATTVTHQRVSFASIAVALLAPVAVVAQQPAASPRWSLGARAIGVLTHSIPSFDGEAETEALVTQPALFAGVSTRDGRFAVLAMASLEGLTLRDGEANPGIWGEGFADRRHPHTYLHELVAVAAVPIGGGGVSLAAGKGFVPFGTDDPMARPFVKYPANHHLAQILERALVAAAWRAGPVALEGAFFNGDEPEDAADAPNLDRFGDSWAARLTLFLPAGLETQASGAAVASPEWAAGFGPDQRKWSASLRHQRDEPGEVGRYLLVEWARTDERVDGRTIFRFESVLAEAAVRRRGAELALRLERTTRPEEERLLDPFRTARPHTDESILGVTRFEIATLAASMALGDTAGARRVLDHVRPFVEVALARPSAARTPSLFRPERFFGARRLWSISVGARLSIGAVHRRMGRYGAALASPRGHPHSPP